MKIGISSIGYESKELIEKCFNSWQIIKNNLSLLPGITDLKICFGHGCFEETAALGFPIYSTDGTCELINQQFNDKVIDDLIMYDTPQKEYEMWTNNFTTLRDKYDIDLLIMVNVDEIWSVEEIQKLIQFVFNNDLVDFFKVNFKNYCIDYNTWVDDFIVPRAWFTKKNGGIKRNYKDELLEYNNEKKDIECSSMTIPKHLIFPKHYSWVGSKEYLQRKLKFQALRYKMCSYSWDHQNDKLQLNKEFYLKFNLKKPILNKD